MFYCSFPRLKNLELSNVVSDRVINVWCVLHAAKECSGDYPTSFLRNDSAIIK